MKKVTNRLFTLLSTNFSALLVVIFATNSKVLAGWQCSSIDTKSLTVGVFGDSFVRNSTAAYIIGLTILLLLFYLALSTLKSVLNRVHQKTRANRLVTKAAFSINLMAILFLAYFMISVATTLFKRSVINPTWQSYDVSFSCYSYTYTLDSSGRFIVAATILISVVCIAFMITRFRFFSIKK